MQIARFSHNFKFHPKSTHTPACFFGRFCNGTNIPGIFVLVQKFPGKVVTATRFPSSSGILVIDYKISLEFPRFAWTTFHAHVNPSVEIPNVESIPHIFSHGETDHLVGSNLSVIPRHPPSATFHSTHKIANRTFGNASLASQFRTLQICREGNLVISYKISHPQIF